MIDLITNIIGVRALLIVTAALLAVCIGLGVTVRIQSAQLDAAQARQESLGEKLATQNRAVSQWKAEANKQAARVQEAAKRAERVRTVTIERVRMLSNGALSVRWSLIKGGRANHEALKHNVQFANLRKLLVWMFYAPGHR